MSRWSALWRSLVAVLLCCLWVGCQPEGESALDEQKNPHYLEGRSRQNNLDYPGAVAAFEKALEANPRSASAHFELGLIYFQNLGDYAAAIYHFERFLRLRPNAEHADQVRQFITVSKQELAKTVSLGPVTQQMQRELDRLTAENAVLHQQIENLQAQLSKRGNPALAASFTPLPASPTNARVAAVDPPSARPETTVTPAGKPAAPAAARAHIVKSGETLAAIARREGVKLEALEAANPGISARKLRVGASLKIPVK